MSPEKGRQHPFAAAQDDYYDIIIEACQHEEDSTFQFDESEKRDVLSVSIKNNDQLSNKGSNKSNKELNYEMREVNSFQNNPVAKYASIG